MVKENNESNAVDLEMNSDVSAGCCMPLFFVFFFLPRPSSRPYLKVMHVTQDDL